MQSKPRVQVQRLDGRLERVQSTAQVGNNFVQGPRPQADTRPQQLLHALSSWNRLAESYVLDQIDEDKRAQEAEAERIAQGKTTPDILQELEAKSLPQWQNPRFQKAFTTQAGRRYAYQTARELQSEWERQGRVMGEEFDAWLADQVGSRLAPFTGNTDFLEGFNGIMPQVLQRLRSQQTDNLNAAYSESVRQGVYEDILGTLELDGGTSPSAAVSQLYASFKDNRDYMGLPLEEQNKLIIAAAEQFAREGRLDVVEAIFDTPRGEGVAALGKTAVGSHHRERLTQEAHKAALEARHRQVMGDRETLIVAAKSGEESYDEYKALLDQWYFSPENKGAMTVEKYEQLLATKRAALEEKSSLRKSALNKLLKERAMDALLEDAWSKGISYTVTGAVPWVDADGQQQEVQSEEVSTYLAQRMRQIVDERKDVALAQGMDPTEVQQYWLQARVQVASGHDQTDPEIRRQISTAAHVANIQDFALDDIRDGMVQGAEMYYWLYQQNPSLAQRHASGGDAARFMDSYVFAREYLQLTEKEALLSARQQFARLRGETDDLLAERYRQLDNAVRELAPTGWIATLWGSNVENGSDVSRHVNRLAKYYSDVGYPITDAIERAKDYLSDPKNSMVVNGWWMPRPQFPYGTPLHQQDIPSLFEAWIEGSREKLEDELLVPVENLVPVPSGSPHVYTLFDKASGTFVSGSDGRMLTVTTQNLLDDIQRVNKLESESAVKALLESFRRRREPAPSQLANQYLNQHRTPSTRLSVPLEVDQAFHNTLPR